MAGLLAWVAAKVKSAIERRRPAGLLADVRLREAHITGPGFISGHTAVSFALATWIFGRTRSPVEA